MAWIKNVLLDIAITTLIVIWLFLGNTWAYWAIIIYTPFLLLLKIVALSSGISQATAQTSDSTPTWFYHGIYAINLILLLVGKWYLVAGAWAIIWVLSAYQQSRTVARKTAKKK
jgi:flagellar biosynthesis protein FliQ